MIGIGEPKAEILEVVDEDGVKSVLTDEELAEMHLRDVTDVGEIKGWVDYFERYGVYFSVPLDLDFMMLQKFPAEYQATGDQGPRIPAPDHPKRADAMNDVVKAVLKGGSDGSTFTDAQKEAFFWYRYLFLGRGKPSTHILALAALDDDRLKSGCPKVLKRLAKAMRVKLGLSPLKAAPEPTPGTPAPAAQPPQPEEALDAEQD